MRGVYGQTYKDMHFHPRTISTSMSTISVLPSQDPDLMPHPQVPRLSKPRRQKTQFCGLWKKHSFSFLTAYTHCISLCSHTPSKEYKSDSVLWDQLHGLCYHTWIKVEVTDWCHGKLIPLGEVSFNRVQH